MTQIPTIYQEDLQYINNDLYFDGVKLGDIAADVGTPCYVTAQKIFLDKLKQYQQALKPLPHMICYAVKANSNLHILKQLAKQKCSFDIVSLGELKRLMHLNVDPQTIIFSGVGKSDEELVAALNYNIKQINVESIQELQRLDKLSAALGKIAPVALRINPQIDANTHPYIATGLAHNKFGIDEASAKQLYATAKNYPHLRFQGIACHIGSQLTEVTALTEALQRLVALWDELNKQHGLTLPYLDIGGGLGVPYQNETIPSIATWGQIIKQTLGERPVTVCLEPGRSISAQSGILLSKVIATKEQHGYNFIIVDASMTELIRPALYQAHHPIVPLKLANKPEDNDKTVDVVGPVCETGDFLAKNIKLSADIGAYIAILFTGAYGNVLASNYNSRPKPCEVLIYDKKSYLIRQREEYNKLWEQELIID